MLRLSKSLFRYKLNLKGLLVIYFLNLLYILQFIRVDCEQIGGRELINFTGFVVLVLSEPHFLTFMIPLSIIYGIHCLTKGTLTELVQYGSRSAWMKSILSAGCLYSTLYYLSLLCIITAVAAAAGIVFEDLKTPCAGMDWVLPNILAENPDADMAELALAMAGNGLLYCITLTVFYLFAMSLTGKRVGAVLMSVMTAALVLFSMKSLIDWFYPYTALGNLVTDISFRRTNTQINWLYWLAVNLILGKAAFFMTRRKELQYD